MLTKFRPYNNYTTLDAFYEDASLSIQLATIIYDKIYNQVEFFVEIGISAYFNRVQMLPSQIDCIKGQLGEKNERS